MFSILIQKRIIAFTNIPHLLAINRTGNHLINKAQISKDADKYENEVDDQDSTPDEWNEGEDDQDIEKIKAQYFDLSLTNYRDYNRKRIGFNFAYQLLSKIYNENFNLKIK